MIRYTALRGPFPDLYAQGWRYRLDETYWVQTGIVGYDGGFGPLEIESDGTLSIYPGYMWDGASGPAIQTKTFVRPSLVHDALYQLIREGVLPREARLQADRLLRQHCQEEGMLYIRTLWVYAAVRIAGGWYLDRPLKK